MSRSSSSSLGSSFMRLTSLRAFGAHGMRKASGARVAVDRLALSLEVAQGVHERGVRARRRLLALGDVAAGGAQTPQAPQAIETMAELLDAGLRVGRRRLGDEQRRQHVAGGLRSEVDRRCASIQSWVASTPSRVAASRDSAAASSASPTLESISATRAKALVRARGPVPSDSRIVRSSA